MPEVYRYRDLVALGLPWSRTCLSRWEKEGRFPPRIPFGKQSAWRRADIDRWLAAQSAVTGQGR
jgi:predicted DNA-binding transcriptional regulator AlpA